MTQLPSQNKVIVFGATGFVGRELLRITPSSTNFQFVFVSRTHLRCSNEQRNIEFVVTDLEDEVAVSNLISEQCVIINLIYSKEGATENYRWAKRLSKIAVMNNCKRLIHLSTTSTYGRPRDLLVTELTKTNPRTPYECIKHTIDDIFIERFEGSDSTLIILKPTAIFGAGGMNLLKMYNEICSEFRFLTFIKSKMNSKRNAHLIPVRDVVEVILFFIERPVSEKIETFIISRDKCARTYGEVEDEMRKILNGSRPRRSGFPLPIWFTEIALFLRGVSDYKVKTIYSGQKLLDNGYQQEDDWFTSCLVEAIESFKRSQ